MAKYLLLKHYRGAPTPLNDVPMDRWTPQEVSARLSSAPGDGGRSIHEWIEVRPFLEAAPPANE